MATKMGYAPGVRIQLKDNSAYTVVQNPNTVAGIVGYASKGELNKIIPVANTGELGTKLGFGYQSYKYNQGMYAANAVLTTGGEVEFVRPYGEEISRTDAYKRDLKTDAFVVAYDKNAALYCEGDDAEYPRTSFNVKHFAATRYKTDGAAEFGVTRKINNIAETVATGKNVDFNVDASENFNDSAASRKYDTELPSTDMVMFAIMNRDPSYANRAYDRYEVVTADKPVVSEDGKTETIKCMLSSKPVFVIGDTVFLPNTSAKLNQYGKKGTSTQAVKATVVDIDGKDVIIAVDISYGTNSPNVIIFNDADNAIADGFDYMNIKTAVAGNTVKNFASIKFGVDDTKPSEIVKDGTLITFRDKTGSEFYVRLANGKSPFGTTAIDLTTGEDGNVSFTLKDADVYVLPGDVLKLTAGDESTLFTVKMLEKPTTGNDITVIGSIADEFTAESAVITFDTMSKDYDAYSVSVSGITESKNNNWAYIAGCVADALQSAKKYSRIAFTNDILTYTEEEEGAADKVGNVHIDGAVIKVDPSASYDYSIGDLVAIVRNDNEFDSIDDAKKVAFDKKLYTITAINPMAGLITVNNEVSIEAGTEKFSYQLLNVSTTNATAYVAQSTYLTEETQSGTNIEVKVQSGTETKTSDPISNVIVTKTGEQYTISKNGFDHAAVDTVITLTGDSTTNTFTVTEVSGDDLIGTLTTPFAEDTTEEQFDSATYKYESPIYTRYIDNATFVANAGVGKEIQLKKGSATDTFRVANVQDGILYEETKPGTAEANTYDNASYTYNVVNDFADLYLMSSYSMYVSKLDQRYPTFGDKEEKYAIHTGIEFLNDEGSTFSWMVDKSPTVLADSDIGASFLALGLATASYIDVNFDGNPEQAFTLTDEGIEIARMFMAIRYRFNGRLYEFEGTIVDYNLNGRQLGIKEAAEYELDNSGLEFVLNDSGVLDYFLENNSYDLSQTIQNGMLNGSYTAIAYNESDPAIVNDAVWTYDPQNNNSGSTLSTVWSLFVNKDGSDVDMLVAAGMAINSPFTKKNETLNTQVMQAMINVCENRKDCFCLFDGVYEPEIDKAVKKMISAGHLSLGRWGFLYDGRGVFQDSLYTQSQADVMKSVQLAAIITANRQSGIFWIPAAGDEAYVPAAWGTKERFTRTYSSEDKNCDHAKLSDIHVNATRVNKDGIRIWGDWTLQMEDTAFNQMHVTMLVAGIHKMFYKYLDHKVFKLNTTILRAQITSDLQDKLNLIIRQNPPGLINGKVICDDTNNTQELIDQNFLIVDLKLLPPKSTRWIILRTSVESTKNGKNITTTIVSE